MNDNGSLFTPSIRASVIAARCVALILVLSSGVVYAQAPDSGPSFTVSGSCDLQGIGSFTITNIGGDMTTPFTYILALNGTPIATNTFELDAGASTNVNTSGLFGTLTLSVLDTSSTVVATDSTVCTAPPGPSFTVNASCDAKGEGTFTITNVGGDMTAPSTYILSINGTPIATNTFELTAGASTDVNTSGLFGTLTLSVLDTSSKEVATGSTVCQGPSFTVNASCDAKGQGSFTITNVGGDMTEAFSYVLALNGAPISTDTFKLANGVSTDVNTSGLFGTLTLSVLDTSGKEVATGSTVCQGPTFTVSGSCDAQGDGTFTITNVGGDMTAPFTYILSINGTPIATNTFELDAGASTDVNTSGLFGTLTLSVLDTSSKEVATGSTVCAAQPGPSFTVNGSCDAKGDGSFTITNVGGDMTAPFTYILSINGTPTATNTFELVAGASTDVNTSGLFGTLTLSVLDTSSKEVATGSTVCAAQPAPSFTVSGSCDAKGDGSFTITNVGGDMTAPFTWSLALDGTPIDQSSFQINAGQSTTINTSGRYGTLTLSVLDTSSKVVATGSTVCQSRRPPPPPPCFTVSGSCNAHGTGVMTITDVGGDMTTPFRWSLALDGKPIDHNSFEIKAGQSITVNTSGRYGTLTLSVLDASNKTVATGSMVCQSRPPPPPPCFTVSGSCNAHGAGVMTIADVGGDMTTPFKWSLALDGKPIDHNSFEINGGKSTTVNTSGRYGTLTLSVLDASNKVVATGSTVCESRPPSFTVSGSCNANGAGVMTITDSGGNMTTPLRWSLALDGKPIDHSSFEINAGQSTAINTNGRFGTLTLSVLDTSNKVVATGSTVCQSHEAPGNPHKHR